MPATAPRIAVLIAAYNAEATLDRAVASALAQPETAEVCIVDDCSSDATLALARAWSERDGRVVALAQSVNCGPASARNAAIAATSAPWLTILDADDYMLAGRLKATMTMAGEADFIADALMRVSEGETPDPPAAPKASSPLTFEAFVRGNLGQTRGPLDLGFLKPIFSRAFIETHGLRYQEQMRLGEDYEFYARALALGARFVTCGPAGYVSVERAGSLSKDHSEADLRRLRDCDAGLSEVRPLSAQERRALRAHWTSVDCRLQWRRLISAVKARNAGAALATFHTPAAATYLAARLAEQAVLRTRAAIGGLFAARAAT
ncbi:MAG: glycosyltransferase family 2 protein [Hyphomonadaceae bacterium]